MVAPDPPLLELHGIGVELGQRTVLDGVELQLQPGEVLGLVGKNGSGKSTLLKVASGVITPQRGAVLWRGAPVQSLDGRARARQLAVVPQDFALEFSFTALEVVLMGRAPRLGPLGIEGRGDLGAAEEAMRSTGVLELADRSFLRLSGGERQRVMIAKALAQETPALLLDEPTAHLDLRHQVELTSLLRRRAGSGLAVLCALHDLNLAARLCHRVALLDEGRVVSVGSPASVMTAEALERVYGTRVTVVPAPDGHPCFLASPSSGLQLS